MPPVSNADRQAEWRARHRPSKRRAVHFAPPPQAAPAPPPPLQAPASQITPLELLGPEALFENHIRKMQPARKLYLAMLIMDDLNQLAGKRKARRNQQYLVQALSYANEMAQLPEPMMNVEDGAEPALGQRIDQPLLAE